MSRPFFRILPAACAVLSIGFSACVGTVYDRMYSNKKTHYKPLAAKKEASAEDVMAALGTDKPSGEQPVDSGITPAPGGEIPGLAPAPGELAPPPAAPDAAPMTPPPGVPGLPPPPAAPMTPPPPAS